jgi:hypothetical protein
MIAICVAGQLRRRFVGKVRVGPLRVDAADAARREFGPTDKLFGFRGRDHLGRHDAVDTRFQALRHGGIVRHRHAHETSQAAGPAHERRHRNLLGRNASVLGIQPKPVVPPSQAKKLQTDRMHQPAGAKDSNQLVGRQQILEKTGHGRDSKIASVARMLTVEQDRP